MPRRFQFSLRAVFLVVAVLSIPLAGIAYLLAPIACPVCHDGDVDTNGRCRYGDSCKYYVTGVLHNGEFVESGPVPGYTGIPGHHRPESCYLCRGKKLSARRFEALIDSEYRSTMRLRSGPTCEELLLLLAFGSAPVWITAKFIRIALKHRDKDRAAAKWIKELRFAKYEKAAKFPWFSVE
jgi:hypothetical protein